METLLSVSHWILFIIIGLFGLTSALFHWGLIVRMLANLVRKNTQDYSTSLCLPFVGPFFVLMALLLSPLDSVSHYWFLFIVIDPQYFIILIGLIGDKLSKR